MLILPSDIYFLLRHALLSAAFPQGIRCQKCFAYGHWSYECTKDKGKNSDQPSRTEKMKPSLKATKGGCRSVRAGHMIIYCIARADAAMAFPWEFLKIFNLLDRFQVCMCYCFRKVMDK